VIALCTFSKLLALLSALVIGVVTEQNLLNVAEAAALLKVPRSWIYGHIHTGDLPFKYFKVGVYVRIARSDIEEFLSRVAVAPKEAGQIRQAK